MNLRSISLSSVESQYMFANVGDSCEYKLAPCRHRRSYPEVRLYHLRWLISSCWWISMLAISIEVKKVDNNLIALLQLQFQYVADVYPKERLYLMMQFRVC